MKNGLLIWNVILSLVAAILLFFQFGPKKNSTGTGKILAKDSTAGNQFRMAYFEMDSVESNFNVVKDVKAEINTKGIEYTNSLNLLDQEYKNRFNELSSQQLTPEQTEAAQNELRQLAEKLKNQKQDLDQKYQDFLMRKNLDIKKKIEDYLKVYNKEKNYSYIISYEQGLFYFKDTAYNITGDIIKGLNDYYKPVKK